MPNKKENSNPFKSLHDTIVYDSKDYSLNRRDMWIYGIVVGWFDDEETKEGVRKDLKRRYPLLKDCDFNRMQILHEEFIKAKELFEEQERKEKNNEGI